MIRITKLLAVAAAAALLAACQTMNTMPPSRGFAGADVTATLASVNTCEYEVAPLKTRTIVLRKATTRALIAGRITTAQAQQVEATADAARALVDRACPKGPTSKEIDRDVVGRAAQLLGVK